MALQDRSCDVDHLPIRATSLLPDHQEGISLVDPVALHQDPLRPLGHGPPPEGSFQRVVLGEPLERHVHRALHVLEIACAM